MNTGQADETGDETGGTSGDNDESPGMETRDHGVGGSQKSVTGGRRSASDNVLRFVGGYPLPSDLTLTAASVQQAIQALGPNVALASFNVDVFRANFKSKAEAKNVLSPMDHALSRKQKASDINN